jgi:hypothetical protein
MGHVQALQIELGLQGTERTVNVQRKLLQLKLSQLTRGFGVFVFSLKRLIAQMP